MFDTPRSGAPSLLDYPHRFLVPFTHQQEIERTLALLTPFLAEPESYKNTWTVGCDDEGESEFGYFRRGEGKDLKQILHYRRNLPQQLRDARVDLKQHGALIDACAALHAACLATTRPLLERFAQELSAERGDGGAFVQEFNERQQRGDALCMPVLRVMEYEPCEPGRIVARRHADHGLVTLHVYSSEPGLRFGFNHETMEDFVDMPVPEGKAAFFPGRKMAGLTDWRVPALVHDVVAMSSDKRRTIVFFDHVDCEKVPRFYRH